jgi:uncharacterized damage-inducible protein DinB
MRIVFRIALLPILLGLGLWTGSAQEPQKPASATSFTAGFRADLLAYCDDFSKKMVALAEAIPQEKYSWRPGEGVRSVGEVFTHVASGNFWYMQMAGIQPPAGVDLKAVDSLKEKAKIIEILKVSCEHVRLAISKSSDADLEKPAKVFGRDGTVRQVFFLLATHQPEHLGQSIAYARMIGVVPPWTAERQAQQPAPNK